MASKRELLANFTNLSMEEVCCEHCERKAQKNSKLYCPWYRIYVKNPTDDFCTFFLHTHKN